jgi:hypothetical protein
MEMSSSESPAGKCNQTGIGLKWQLKLALEAKVEHKPCPTQTRWPRRWPRAQGAWQAPDDWVGSSVHWKSQEDEEET